MSKPGEITLTVTPAPGKAGRFLVDAVNGVGPLNRDTIDLNSATARKRFVGETLRKAFAGRPPDDWPDGVRSELEDRLLALSRVPPGPPEPPAAPPGAEAPADTRVTELAKMPDDVRAEAAALLRNPRLLERVSADIEALGVVGERQNRMLLYLVGTSAQLVRPLAVITRGASSSGKSFVGDRVATLFPPEVVLYATSLTTNALYYFEPGTLRHRWVIAGERSRVEDDDQAEATRALREMIEAGRLVKAVPVKEHDRIATKEIKQDGPIAYTETTSKAHVFAEDANRCLLLNTDEGEAQTKDILGATARAAAGETRGDAERLRAVHHALQRMIPRVDVVVPFAAAIAEHYPTARLESRRDFRHLLQLVRAVALLHFQQRERGESAEVVATLADYAVAEKLARVPLGVAATGVTEKARQFLKQLREKFAEGEFTTNEAANKIKGAVRRTVAGRLSELAAAGAVEQTAPHRGQVPARWKLTDLILESAEGVLPTVEQVAESYSRCQHASRHEGES